MDHRLDGPSPISASPLSAAVVEGRACTVAGTHGAVVLVCRLGPAGGPERPERELPGAKVVS